MDEERKDEIIAALNEMVLELQNKLINLRVEAGLKLKEKDRQIESLLKEKEENERRPVPTNGKMADEPVENRIQSS